MNYTSADEGSKYTSEFMVRIWRSNDKHFAWAVNFITGYEYHVHWKWGIDFTTLGI